MIDIDRIEEQAKKGDAYAYDTLLLIKVIRAAQELIEALKQPVAASARLCRVITVEGFDEGGPKPKKLKKGKPSNEPTSAL